MKTFERDAVNMFIDEMVRPFPLSCLTPEILRMIRSTLSSLADPLGDWRRDCRETSFGKFLPRLSERKLLPSSQI
jgi:hypothetical protein